MLFGTFSATIVGEMPISILSLARKKDGVEHTESVTIESLEDVTLTEPIVAEARVTKLDFDTFSVHISANALISLRCDRCLAPLHTTLHLDFSTTFRDQPEADEGEWPILANSLDIAGPIREEILLNLPLRNVCESECPKQ